MKAVRLLQIIVLLAAGAYLVLLHDLNDVNVVLPFLMALPPAAVLVLALLLGWLLGWLPLTARNFKRDRELRRLKRRLAELEEKDDNILISREGTPIIPDRRTIEDEEPYEGPEQI